MTEHQVRYLSAQRCIQPSAHVPETFGDSALYSAVDVALIRLISRLVAEGAPYWMARAAVAQRAKVLRRALASGLDAAFVVTGPTGELDPKSVPTSGPVWTVRLSDVRRGLTAAIRDERQQRPVWAGWAARTPAQTVELVGADT
jgi:hypothetical protein